MKAPIRKTGSGGRSRAKATGAETLKAYERPTKHQRAVEKWASIVRHRLTLLNASMKWLLADRTFVEMMVESGFESVPEPVLTWQEASPEVIGKETTDVPAPELEAGQSGRLVNGLCEQAAALLADRKVSPRSLVTLRMMKPERQVAAAKLMRASNRFSHLFVQALKVGTSDEMLQRRRRGAKANRLSRHESARLVSITDSLISRVAAVDHLLGRDALTLVVGWRYIERVLANRRLSTYVRRHHAKLYSRLTKLIVSISKDRAGGHILVRR